jgi:hypothetical protein
MKVAIERNQNFPTAKGSERRLGVGIEDYGLPEMQGDLRKLDLPRSGYLT